jgi:hypothetical protein
LGRVRAHRPVPNFNPPPPLFLILIPQFLFLTASVQATASSAPSLLSPARSPGRRPQGRSRRPTRPGGSAHRAPAQLRLASAPATPLSLTGRRNQADWPPPHRRRPTPAPPPPARCRFYCSRTQSWDPLRRRSSAFLRLSPRCRSRASPSFHHGFSVWPPKAPCVPASQSPSAILIFDPSSSGTSLMICNIPIDFR